MQYIFKLHLMTTLAKMHSQMLNPKEKIEVWWTKMMNECEYGLWLLWVQPEAIWSEFQHRESEKESEDEKTLCTSAQSTHIHMHGHEPELECYTIDTIETEMYEKAFLLVCL